jgi:hypothetical protein
MDGQFEHPGRLAGAEGVVTYMPGQFDHHAPTDPSHNESDGAVAIRLSFLPFARFMGWQRSIWPANRHAGKRASLLNHVAQPCEEVARGSGEPCVKPSCSHFLVCAANGFTELSPGKQPDSRTADAV